MADVFWIFAAFLSFFSHLVVSRPGGTCDPPTRYRDRVLEESQRVRVVFNDGARVKYKCAYGYSQSGGSRFSFCQKGVWSPLELQCQRKICGSAGEILNGRLTQTGNAFGDTAQAECNEGYVLRGKPVRECRANGWSGTIPTCVVIWSERGRIYEAGGRTAQLDKPMSVQVTCSRPAVPNSIRPDRYKTGYVVGEHATVSCQEGFELTSSSQVTCGADGQWQKLPECRFAGGKCSSPPIVPNAHTEHGNYRHYESNATVRYKCNHGYRTVRGPNSVYCRNGRWSDVQMTCEKKVCGSAGEIMNGRYHYTGASFGDTATAQCDRGYFLMGVAERNCTANGWDGREAECEAVQCSDPPRVPDADLIFDTSGVIKHGYMASYQCRFGTLIGASHITCTEDGTWSAPAPQCKVICPTPYLQYGVIVSGIRPRYHPENSVKFKCNPGKKLLGARVIVCGGDGHWKPRPPVCK